MRNRTIIHLAAALVLCHCSGGAKKARLTPEEVEQICIHIVSCEHAMYAAIDSRVSECVNDLMWLGGLEMGTFNYSDVVSCLIDAGTDCDALWRCGNEGRPPEACDPTTFTDRCDGDLMVVCSGGYTYYFDCSRYDPIYGDATCQVDPTSGDLDCVSTTTCTADSTACDGDFLEMCGDGDFYRVDCSLMGATCRQYVPGYYTCVGTGASCTDEGGAWCDGSAIVRCAGGREARFDCARLGEGFSCLEPEPDSVECAPSGTECDAETHVDTCDGTTVQYCRWGFLDSADCTTHGYGSCIEGTTSAFCE